MLRSISRKCSYVSHIGGIRYILEAQFDHELTKVKTIAQSSHHILRVKNTLQ